MKIRKKIYLVLLFVFLLILLISLFVSYFIVLKSFNDLEKEKVSANLSLIERAINQEINNLDSINGDWSRWDDTYEFVKGNYDSYPESNLDFTTLSNLRVNAMLFYDSKQQLTYKITADFESNVEGILSPNILRHIEENNLLKDQNDEGAKVKGFIVVDDSVVFLSSQPIVKSTGEGEIAGRLLILRFFDEHELSYIKSLIEQDFIFQTSLADFKDHPELLDSNLLNQGKAIFIAGDNEINSFGVLNDLNQKPSLIIKQSNNRSIYQRGRDSVIFFVITLFALLVILTLALFFLLNKIIILRMLKLGHELEDIAENRSFYKRVSVNNDDEITVAQKKINSVLSALEESLEKSRQSELELNKKKADLEKANKELEETLEYFYTFRLNMQKDIETGRVEEENKKIKNRIEELKNKA